MHIFVGSTNPVKLNAATIAASETWPEAVVKGYEVDSRVSHQPLSDQETKDGALERAKAALQKGMQEFSISSGQLSNTTEFLGIGLEGGVFTEKNGELWNTVWACVIDLQGNTFFANGERFLLPKVLADKIKAGAEMGPAMDEITGSVNIKHQHGMIGIITKRFIDRTELYANLAKLALGLWYGREWERELVH